MKTSEKDKDFEQKLVNIRLSADELPVAVVIHRLSDFFLVYMNQPGLDVIGATLKEVQSLSQEEYHDKYFNREDSDDYVPKIIDLVNSNKGDHISFFQQVRTLNDADWVLFVSNSKVFHRNEAGEATHMITIAGMVDPEHHITAKMNRVMAEISFLRNNTLLFLKLTKREKEILKYMAMGSNSGSMSEKLFISSGTVDTHRRNIRKKLGLKNNYDAVKFAQAYNLV